MGIKFGNRKALFDEVRRFEGALSTTETKAISFLLDQIEKDPYLNNIFWAAYMFATIKRETGHTYRPIHEYGSHARFVRLYGSQTSLGRRLGNDTPEEGAIYAGQGYVQLTGEDNYERAEDAIRAEYPGLVREFEERTGRVFDLTVGDQPGDLGDPANAQDPGIAYAIMSYGMRTGMFTGRKLADYTSGNSFNALQARRIINGTDAQKEIEGYYFLWLKALKAGAFQSVKASPEQKKEPEQNNILDVPGLEPEAGEGESTAQPPIANPPDGPPAKVAIQKPEKQGFMSGFFKRVSALLGTNLTLEVAADKAQQAGTLGLSNSTWEKIGVAIAIASLVYLAVYAWDYWNTYKRNKQITADLIAANSTDSNSVQLIDADLSGTYEALGYKVITR